LNIQEPVQPGKPPKKKGCLRGCLVTLLVVAGIVALGVLAVWKLVIDPFPDRFAKALRDAPYDIGATDTLKEALKTSGEGVTGFVFPLPGEDGKFGDGMTNAALVTIDMTAGFTPGGSAQAIRDQAFGIVQNLVQANAASGLAVSEAACSVADEKGIAATIVAPMGAMQDWASGRIGDDAFYRQVTVQIRDASRLGDLLQGFFGHLIEQAIFGKLFGG
jgi:hypothetical protein